MKNKTAISAVLAVAIAAAPIVPASAHGWDHGGYYHGGGHGGGGLLYGGGGLLFGVGAVVGAVAGAALTLAAAPFNAVVAVAAPPEPVYAQPAYAPGYGYPPAPVYAQPVPVAYPGYYTAPQPIVVYGGHPGYYARAGYYGHRYYR